MAQAMLRQEQQPAVSHIIAAMLGRKMALVQKVWSDFCSGDRNKHFQLIKLVWGVVKGAVGHQYTKDTTIQDVRVYALTPRSWLLVTRAELYGYIMTEVDMPNDD
ncbi:hypothetical protein ACHHYP_20805 [Achlya hypogyna]|uniref:Uncharacterized protein n=1 Tax=Achlya hypogyna TaxID=1202772 RepID=A0A1V9Y954_ACHHY|nr:hypothetical protein ACHHYP_20805 [Achlya hypogyna]